MIVIAWVTKPRTPLQIFLGVFWGEAFLTPVEGQHANSNVGKEVLMSGLEQGSFGKRVFSRSSLSSLEKLENLEILERSERVENKGESDHFLEILELVSL